MKKVKKQVSKIKFFYYKVALVLTLAVMAATVFQLPQTFIHSANKEFKQVIKDISATEDLLIENELNVKTTVLPLSDNQLQVTLDIASQLPTTSLENDNFILLVDQSASMNEYQATYEKAINVLKQSVAEKSNKTAQIQEIYYNVVTPALENEFTTLKEAISSLSTLVSKGDASKTHILLVTDSVLNDEIPTTEVTVSEEEIQAKMPEVIEVPEIVVTEEQIQAKMPEVIEVPEVTISEGEEIDVEARQAELQQEAYDQAYALATEAAKQEAYNQAYEAAYQLATEQAKSEKALTANQENYQSIVQGFNQSLTELSELTKESDLSVLALPSKARESQVDYQTITQIEMTDLSELEAKLMEWVSTFEHTQNFNQFNLNYEVSSLFKIVEDSLISSVEGVMIDNSYVNINLKENIPTTMNLSFTVELVNDEKEINQSVTLTNSANVSYQLGEGDLKTSDLPTTEVNIETKEVEFNDENAKQNDDSLLEQNSYLSSTIGELVQDSPDFYTVTTTGQLHTNKSASWSKEEDLGTIQFEISGTPSSTKYSADIVLVIDTSLSMSIDNLIPKAQEAAINFCNSLITNQTKDYVRIAVVSYNERATINHTFTNELEELEEAIDEAVAKTASGTNIQDAINKAAEVLNSSPSGAEQFVLFFTDGLPSAHYNEQGTLINTGNTQTDDAAKAAQKAFYQNFFHYDKTYNEQQQQISIGGIIEPTSPETITLSKTVNCPNATFYSVGLIKNNDNFQKAKNLLSTIQNAENPSTFDGITNDGSSIDGLFQEIANKIGEKVNSYIALDARLQDIVSEEFKAVQDTVTITPVGDNTPLSNEKLQQLGITWSWDTDEIGRDVFNITLGNIPITGYVITFKIKAINSYLAGIIETNDSASLTYKPSEGAPDVTNPYSNPKVDIPPKIGTIKVTKRIEGGEPQSNDDRFSIIMKGDPETYTVDLAANTATVDNSQTLTFYMRDDETPIELNTTYNDYNYLTVGNYSVSELLPANYELVGIDSPSFTIDKDHPNISITVTNKIANDDYWYDKDNEPNKFTYVKPNTGASTTPKEE